MQTFSRKMMRKTALIALAAAIPVASGCSAFQPRTQRVTIIPSDPTAQVYLNNDPVGSGRTTIELERNKSYAISARNGTSMGSATIGRRVSGTGVLDIVGGCVFLVPFVGCFTPGFWELDKTTVSVPVAPTATATLHEASGH
ncbi:MAG: hypothetical protein M3403_07835 [Gemmatimonadota bacterium]|nr:hypothetical protein [Gemmatimonadota bacterium]